MKAFELSSRFPHQRGHRNWERVAWVILTPLTLALVSAHVLLNGHAAGTASTSTTQASIAIDSLHIGAAGIWVGGLLVAVGVIVPLARRGWLDATVAWVVLRGFAWLAAVCLVVLVSTGLYKTGQRVASVDALVLTLFGKALLVKLVLVACVALIGLINTSVLHPSVADVFARMLRRPVGWTLIAPRRLRRLVFVEAAGAVIVLLFGALLASAPPARGPEFEAVSGASLPSEPVTMRVDDLWVGVSVKPNQPGPSFLRVDVYNTRRPAPAPISNVMARLEAPDGHERDVALMLVPGASASYQATGSLFNVPGRWNVVITVDRLGMPPANTRVPWMVGDGTLRGNRRETLLSSRPLEGLLTIGAALVTLVSGLGLAAIRFRGPVADSLSYVRATLLSRYHPSVAKEDL